MDTNSTPETFRERIVNIARRRVGDIDHNPRNPKRYEKKKSDRLTAVLQQFGKAGVLLTYIDDTGTERFFDGNTRKRLGDDEVWYIAQTDLTQREVDDLVMLYDPLAAPDWEAEMLKALAADTAVSGAELEGMIGELLAAAGVATEPAESQDAEPQTNRAEELRQEWGVETGQLWRLPSRTPGQEHRLICGDCTDAAVVKRVMGEKRVDIVCTDPPWGVSYDGGTTIREKLENDEDASIFGKFLPQIPYKNDTPIYCWFAHSKSEPTFSAFRANGWEIRSVIIWVKNHAQFGALSAHYKEKKEPLIYAFRKGKVPKWRGPTNEVTVWEADRKAANKLHPTEKPVELHERAIQNGSDRGDIVYEPFSGSGTTIIAAENLARQCRAVEISPGYVAVALQRYLDAFGIRAELVTP